MCVFVVFYQLLRGAPDSLLRSLHVQKDPTAYNYIKVGGQIKVVQTIGTQINSHANGDSVSV